MHLLLFQSAIINRTNTHVLNALVVSPAIMYKETSGIYAVRTIPDVSAW